MRLRFLPGWWTQAGKAMILSLNFLRNVVLVVRLAKLLIADQRANANPSLSRVCELRNKKQDPG
jgi:hypothetical protein